MADKVRCWHQDWAHHRRLVAKAPIKSGVSHLEQQDIDLHALLRREKCRHLSHDSLLHGPVRTL